MIQLSGISKSYDQKLILDNISLSIEEGFCVGLIGGSGTGKSLLARLILGLEIPDKGSILVDGKSVLSADGSVPPSFYDRFGVVFQKNALFDSLSIRENIGLRLDESDQYTKEEADQAVEQALSEVGLESSVLQQYPAELSGGMQKRVGVARAIVHRPSYLIYDEPTAGLDPVNADRIDRLIAELNKTSERSSIVITHDIHSLRHLADHVVMIHNQSIYFQGTFEELIASEDEVLHAYIARERSYKNRLLGGGSI